MTDLPAFRRQHKKFLEILVWMSVKSDSLKSKDPKSHEMRSFLNLVNTFFTKQAEPLDQAFDELSEQDKLAWLEETRNN